MKITLKHTQNQQKQQCHYIILCKKNNKNICIFKYFVQKKWYFYIIFWIITYNLHDFLVNFVIFYDFQTFLYVFLYQTRANVHHFLQKIHTINMFFIQFLRFFFRISTNILTFLSKFDKYYRFYEFYRISIKNIAFFIEIR